MQIYISDEIQTLNVNAQLLGVRASGVISGGLQMVFSCEQSQSIHNNSVPICASCRVNFNVQVFKSLSKVLLDIGPYLFANLIANP